MVNQAMKGLPQGAAPSTILSILALSDWFKELKKKGIGLLMYADDGLLYSDEEFKPYPPMGFEFAQDKCK
jgi:retron-type reverse transcriptase